MPFAAISDGPMTRVSKRVLRHGGAMLGLGASAAVAAVLVRDALFASALFSVAGALLAVMAMAWVVGRLARRRNRQSVRAVTEFVAHDAAPSVLADADGGICHANASARARFGVSENATVASLLPDVFANPSAVLHRLQLRAQTNGAAREDAVMRQGHLRIAVHRLNHGAFLWRFEDIADRPAPGRFGLAQRLPMITAGRGGTILFMNEAARVFIGHRVKSIEALFGGAAPRMGEINMINTVEGQRACLVSDGPATGGRREIVLVPAKSPEVAGGWRFFEDLPVPLLRLDADASIILSNRLARDLFGKGNCEGQSLPNLMEGLGRSVADWLAEAIDGRPARNSEFLRLSRTDREVFVQVTLTRVDTDGAPSLIAVINDATKLKTLEAQFVQSQKMQAIGELAGGVAHDFNNLLTAISGHCDLLLLRHDQGDPAYADLVQINQNANRAASLVGQLLAFSRKQTLCPEVLDLRNTLSDLTHLLNRLVGERVRLNLTHDPENPMIRADKRQLEQVMMNLVVNARDAMPEGGEIRIETDCITLKSPLERDRAIVPPGKYVRIMASDDGVGIDPEKLPKVFEPFFTTKRTGEGTGLGLSTAYGIIKQSGGYIFADSVPGSGSSFSLIFPLHELSPADRIEAPEPQSAKMLKEPEEGVILLVEDEAPVRAFAARALRLRGYTVLEAESAEGALETLQDSDLAVDVFVTDVVMPGMDGPSWVVEALKSRPNVRVIFVSGYAEEAFGNVRAHILNSVFLPKPFSLSQLTETVSHQLQ